MKTALLPKKQNKKKSTPKKDIRQYSEKLSESEANRKKIRRRK